MQRDCISPFPEAFQLPLISLHFTLSIPKPTPNHPARVAGMTPEDALLAAYHQKRAPPWTLLSSFGSEHILILERSRDPHSVPLLLHGSGWSCHSGNSAFLFRVTAKGGCWVWLWFCVLVFFFFLKGIEKGSTKSIAILCSNATSSTEL